MSEPANDTTEPGYYCPGCGTRYETPGICTGTAESTHEPLTVASVTDTGATTTDAAATAPTAVEAAPPAAADAPAPPAAPAAPASGASLEERVAALEQAVFHAAGAAAPDGGWPA